METNNNVQFNYAVNTQPQYTAASPSSNCCSRCWQAIFHCSTSTPSPIQREMVAMEVHQETITPPLTHLSLGSAFPAKLAKDLEDGNDGTPGEASEDQEDDFIRGYPNSTFRSAISDDLQKTKSLPDVC